MDDELENNDIPNTKEPVCARCGLRTYDDICPNCGTPIVDKSDDEEEEDEYYDRRREHRGGRSH